MHLLYPAVEREDLPLVIETTRDLSKLPVGPMNLDWIGFTPAGYRNPVRQETIAKRFGNAFAQGLARLGHGTAGAGVHPAGADRGAIATPTRKGNRTMSDDAMTRERVVRRGSGEPGNVSLSGIEGRGRAVQPPRWRRWRDWLQEKSQVLAKAGLLKLLLELIQVAPALRTRTRRLPDGAKTADGLKAV